MFRIKTSPGFHNTFGRLRRLYMMLTRRIRNFLVLSVLCSILIAGSPSWAAQDGKGNILIFWTDQDRLKAITLMTVPGYGNPVGIVAIPVFIRINDGEQHFTISEIYTFSGREGLTCRLEQLFQTPITSYLAVDQSTLEKASRILGPIVMEDRTTTLVTSLSALSHASGATSRYFRFPT